MTAANNSTQAAHSSTQAAHSSTQQADKQLTAAHSSCIYHKCIFTYINIYISHIKPLFRSHALSSAYTPSRLSKRLKHAGFMIQTLTDPCTFSSAFSFLFNSIRQRSVAIYDMNASYLYDMNASYIYDINASYGGCLPLDTGYRSLSNGVEEKGESTRECTRILKRNKDQIKRN